MEKYVAVMCQATLVVLQEFKRKGHLTPKEKLHVLQFIFFMVTDFCKNIQLEHDRHTQTTQNNLVFGGNHVIDCPKRCG